MDSLSRWGTKVLAYLAPPRPPGTDPGTATPLGAAYGWRPDCRAPLPDGDARRQIVATTAPWGSSPGLAPRCAQPLGPRVPPLVRPARGQRVAQQFLPVVETEAATAAPHERCLGSREVMASVFGKLTRLAHPHAQRGCTGLVRAAGAVVAKPTHQVLDTALETLPP